MLNQSISTPLANPKPGAAVRSDQFLTITGHAGLVATEFSYKKDEEIYGEDEPSDYVYQVICG
jgi:CRP/FNR family nitrogen fixation transcriptional regulator